MLTLISGGAGSGKSEYAESLILRSGAHPRIYLATMEVWDEEGRRRVARHRAMRAGKGFQTVEQPRELERAVLPAGSAVLLECLSNLTANECFGPQGFDRAEERLLGGVLRVASQAEELVVVTNELFSDGISYPSEAARYLSVLAGLNRALATRAGRVIEICCGLPVCWKGELP